MKRFCFLLLFVCANSIMFSQTKHVNKDARPEIKEVLGDLNKDGIEDKIVIETPRNKEHMLVREGDGYEYNFNQPILKIYFGDANHKFKLFKKYDAILPHPEDEYVIVDLGVSVTNKGVLRFGTSTFAAAGSYDTGSSTYLYRFQDGDFYLIGYDYTESSRSTGERTTVSINYLTNKKQVVKANNFNNSKPKETWSNIPKKNLEKLGNRLIGE